MRTHFFRITKSCDNFAIPLNLSMQIFFFAHIYSQKYVNLQVINGHWPIPIFISIYLFATTYFYYLCQNVLIDICRTVLHKIIKFMQAHTAVLFYLHWQNIFCVWQRTATWCHDNVTAHYNSFGYSRCHVYNYYSDQFFQLM